MFPPQFPAFNAAQQVQIIYGANFAASVPAGAMWVQTHPMGAYVILPPRSTVPPASPAVILIEPVTPMLVPSLMQSLYSMDNPFVAMMQGMSLGLGNISHVAAARRTLFGQNAADIREVEGMSLSSGQPVRGMLMLLHGPRGTAKVVIMINLFRWAEFVGPALQFVGGINLSGTQPLPAPEVQAVVDRQRTDQIEFRVRSGPTDQWEPITALPTRVGGSVIINIDNSFHVGNITGAGNAIGHHSTSTVGSISSPA